MYIYIYIFHYEDTCLFVYDATAPPGGPGHPHLRGFSIIHNDALQSIGLLWTSDQLVEESSLTTHTILTTVIHPCPGGFQTHNLRRPEAADLRLRPRGHWDRHKDIQILIFFVIAVLIMAPLDATTG